MDTFLREGIATLGGDDWISRSSEPSLSFIFQRTLRGSSKDQRTDEKVECCNGVHRDCHRRQKQREQHADYTENDAGSPLLAP